MALLLRALQDAGIIQNHALFGATAQMRYTEPVATLDVDVLVVLSEDAGLAPLSAIYRFCEALGYHAEGEAILVGAWPVQFIPVFSDLTKEAVSSADKDEIDGVAVRAVNAAYLAVIALSVGRAKDHLRIVSLLESDAVTRDDIQALALRHNLSDQWERFQRRFLNE